MIYNCRKCGIPLIVAENVTQHRIDHCDYICRSCARDYRRVYQPEYQHRTGRQQPMSENRECSLFLGVHIAERVLSHVFKNVHRMPYGHTGYDFICSGGYMIDVKSSCSGRSGNRSDRWRFAIRKNKIAEYFLLLAFDNRDNLSPKHIWLIPSNVVNDYVIIGVSETTLSKWDEYKLDVDRVSACCNALKGIV